MNKKGLKFLISLSVILALIGLFYFYYLFFYTITNPDTNGTFVEEHTYGNLY